MTKRDFPPIHPGEILLEEFMKPLGISQNKLGEALHVPVPRINQICQGKRSISADTALRLARYFGMTPDFWMNLQSRYDLLIAADKMGDQVEAEVHQLEAAS